MKPPDNPEPKMSRPVPNPGILEIAPYTPGKSPVPEPGRKVFKLSANETPFGPSPKAIAAYKHAARHLEDYPEGTSRVLREAIGRAFGLDPDRIICGAGSDEILNLLAHTYLGHGDEAISTAHGFLVYPIATMANGAKQRRRAGDQLHRRRRRDPGAGDAAHQAGVARQPEQPDRNLHSVRRGQAAARRTAAACAAGARRGLFRLRLAQRLRDRHRTGGDHREHGDDPHVLQDPRPCRACGSAGCSARPISSTRSIASADRSTSRRRRCWRRSRRSRTPRISRCRRRIPRSGAAG